MKTCQSCGKSLGEDSKFCPSCGAPVNQEEQLSKNQTSAALEAETRTQQAEMKSKKGFFSKKTIIIALIILLIGASGAAALLLKKSPKELYLLSEYKSYQEAKQEWDTKYGDAITFQEKLLETPSNSEVVLSGDMELDSLKDDPDFEMVRELLKSTSISAKTVQDPVQKESHYSVALNVEKEKAVDIEMFQSKEQMGIKVPLLYEKFFYLNLDEYGDFMRMLDPYYEGPETLEMSELDLKELKITDKEKEYLQKRYADFLLGELKDNNFDVKNGIDYEYEGENMKLREVTLSLSEAETKALLNKFMDHMIEDKELHNMIATRIEKFAKTAALENSDVEIPEKNEMIEEMVAVLKDVKDEMKSVDYPIGFTSTLLIDKNEIIIDRNVKAAISIDGKQVNAEIASKHVPYGDNQKYNEWKMTLAPEEDKDSSMVFQVSNDVKNGKETRTEKLKASAMLEEFGEKEDITFTLTSNFKGEAGSKQDINREFDLAFNGDSFYDVPNELKGEIKQVSDLNLKKNYQNETFKIKLLMEDDYDSGALTLNLDSKTKLEEKVSVPNFDTNSAEGINVVKISDEQMLEISEAVGTNLLTLGEKYGLIPEDYYYGYEEELYGTDMDAYYDIPLEDYYY